MCSPGERRVSQQNGISRLVTLHARPEILGHGDQAHTLTLICITSDLSFGVKRGIVSRRKE